MIQLPTAGLLIVQNRKLLLAYSRNKQCFYLPGGKIDKGETAALALCREIAEEMNVAISEHVVEIPYAYHSSCLWGRAGYYYGTGLLLSASKYITAGFFRDRRTEILFIK
jgi:8-oxo-dGTP pyrophosphatase MutT (NUDIX family)